MTTTPSAGDCRLTLLGLPAELRLEIFSKLMETDHEIRIYPPNGQLLSSQFLRTCRQIYIEASVILYGQNSFNIDAGYLDAIRQSIGEHNLAKMRKVKLIMGRGSWSFDRNQNRDYRELARADMFRELRILDYHIHSGLALRPNDYMLEVYAFLERLIDNRALPRLDRMTIRKPDEYLLSRQRYRLTLSDTPLLDDVGSDHPPICFCE
jgi:hypothetical protein